MSSRVATVVVPGFWGFFREGDDLPADAGASGLLESLWLSFLEGGVPQPGRYELALPEQGLLVGEVPPEPGFEALGRALPRHVAEAGLSFFVYDWRRDLTETARELAASLLDGPCSAAGMSSAGPDGRPEVDLIGVGPGALIVRYLLESGSFATLLPCIRRVVLIGPPGMGIPAAVLLFNGLLSVFDPAAALEEVLGGFPAAFQLLPPPGSPALSRATDPGARVDVFGSAEALLAGTGSDAGGAALQIPAALLGRAGAMNGALHQRLARGIDSSWSRTLVFAGSGYPTYSELCLRAERGGAIDWAELAPVPASGDGVVPLLGATPHPTVRHMLGSHRHLDLPSDPALMRRLDAFLCGSLV